MEEKKSFFPKGFFDDIPTYTPDPNKELTEDDIDYPFEWSPEVLNGTAKVQIVGLKIDEEAEK